MIILVGSINLIYCIFHLYHTCSNIKQNFDRKLTGGTYLCAPPLNLLLDKGIDFTIILLRYLILKAVSGKKFIEFKLNSYITLLTVQQSLKC